MAQRKRNPRYVTEVGVAQFPYLVKPDTEYNPDGEYKVRLKLPAQSTLRDSKGQKVGTLEDFLTEKHQEALEAAKRKANGKKVKEAELPFDEDAEGNTVLRAKLKANVTPRNGEPFSQKPAIFDAAGKPIEPEAIWSGSRMKINFEVVPYNKPGTGCGLSLRLKAVQIIELVAGSGGSAEAYGFGAEEGFESDESASTDEHDGGDDDDFFDDEEGGDF